MITIQTSTSRIRRADGTLMNGILTVTPTEAFTFTDGGGAKSKVTANAVSVNVANGVLAAPLTLFPCQGTGVTPAGVLYQAVYAFRESQETELWKLNTDGLTFEITDVPLG